VPLFLLAGEAGRTVHELKILYVEDCEEMGRFVKTLLGKNAYSVKIVRTGREAIAAARNSQFDLYMLDVALPDCSGIELCRSLRQFDAVTPALFLSALDGDSERREAIAAGAQEYHVKPLGCQDMLTAVSRVIASSPGAAPAFTR
jgi:DNA-binding response OmpR family regulator